MSPVMGGKLGKSEKSSQAGVGFGEFLQACGGALKRKKGDQKRPSWPCSGGGGAAAAVAAAQETIG